MFQLPDLTRRVIPVGCACLIAVLAVGCESQPDRDGGGMTNRAGGEEMTTRGRTMPSPTLLDVTGEVLADAMRTREQNGTGVPAASQSPQFVDMVVESIRLQFPEAYAVTEAEEQRLRTGELDDEANADRIDELLNRLDQQPVQLNTVTQHLVDLYRNDQLRGLGLELTARLLDARLSAPMMGEPQDLGDDAREPAPPVDAPQGVDDRQPPQPPEPSQQPPAEPEQDEPDLRIEPEEEEQAPEPPALPQPEELEQPEQSEEEAIPFK